MKSILALIASAILADVSAQAAPYIVYTGTASGYVSTASGTSVGVINYTVLTDINATTTFAVMEVDPKSKIFTVVMRPSGSPTAEEAATNFFGGIFITGTKIGQGIFSFTDDQIINSGTLSTNSESYATGPLTATTVTLVAARVKPLVVTTKVNGVVTGTQTFPTSALISSGGTAFPKALKGAYAHFDMDSSGNMLETTQGGVLSLVENPVQTSLANIGGALVAGKNVSAIQMVTASTSQAYVTWLTALGTAEGYTQVTNMPAIVAASTSSEGGSLSLDSSVSNGGGLTITGSTGETGDTTVGNGGTLNMGGSTGGGSVTLDNGVSLQAVNAGATILSSSNHGSGSVSNSTTPDPGSGSLTKLGSGNLILNLGDSGSTSGSLSTGSLINFGATTLSGGSISSNFSVNDFTIQNLSGIGTLNFNYNSTLNIDSTTTTTPPAGN